MTKTGIRIAVSEANRFIRRAEVVLALKDPNENCEALSFPTKEAGALKRSSMDLTRALADLRRPN